MRETTLKKGSAAFLRDDAVLEPEIEGTFLLVIPDGRFQFGEKPPENIIAELFLADAERNQDREPTRVVPVEKIALDEILGDVASKFSRISPTRRPVRLTLSV